MVPSSPRVGGGVSQPLARRASAGFTPVLGAVHERSDSATSQSDPGVNDPLLSRLWPPSLGAASRRASVLPTAIKRKARRGTSRRQQAWIVVIVVIAGWTLLGGSKRATESASSFVQQRKTAKGTACRYTPWLKRCRSTGVDPFQGLKYDVRHGLLHYPAVLDDPDASRDPLNPPVQPHAIHYLIRDAQRAWQNKQESQSSTLSEAVAEYRRRYNGQNPPKGFDVWYEFARKHNVQLIDEYDSIWQRILPFAAIPSSVLRQRSNQMQNDDKLWLMNMGFTIRIRPGGEMSVDGPMRHVNNRPDQSLDLLKNIAHLIPVAVNLTITGKSQ